MVQLLTLYWTMDPDPGTLLIAAIPPPLRGNPFFFLLPRFSKWPIPADPDFVEGDLTQDGTVAEITAPPDPPAEDPIVEGPIGCRHVVCAILLHGSAEITCYLRLGTMPEKLSRLRHIL